VTPVAVLLLAGTPLAMGEGRGSYDALEKAWRGHPAATRGRHTPTCGRGGVPHYSRSKPPGSLNPRIYERHCVLYAVAFGLRLKRIRESEAVRPLTQTWGGERCGRRRHAGRATQVKKCESCTRRAAAAKQSCTRRAATAKPGRGRRGRRTAGEPAHRRGAHGHRRPVVASDSGVYESGP
jgi:hypothetical protein